MEQIINQFKNISNVDIKSNVVAAFDQLYEKLIYEINSEFKSEKSILEIIIAKFLDDSKYSQYFIEEIKKRSSYTRDKNDYDNIIIQALINSSSENAISFLKEILNNGNIEMKKMIFCFSTTYTIRLIFQTEECKMAIVDYVNSDYFLSYYEESKLKPVRMTSNFIFPYQYINCFDIKKFSDINKPALSNSKMSKLATELRLESIRLIKNNSIKMELILRYYNELPTLYKNRFVKLVDRTFPELKLKKFGHNVYSRNL
jgi:hypothetical protein